MNGRRRAAGTLAAGCLSVLAGCGLMVPRLLPPHLSVADVQVQKADLFEQHLKVRMRVQNPNDRRLPVKSLDYDLELEGEPLAHGVSADAFTVPALGEAEFDTYVTVNMAGALVRLMKHQGGDGLDYRIHGKVALAEGLLRSVPFDERGKLRLDR